VERKVLPAHHAGIHIRAVSAFRYSIIYVIHCRAIISFANLVGYFLNELNAVLGKCHEAW